jgi:surface antigen
MRKIFALGLIFCLGFPSYAHADASFWGGAVGAGLGGLVGSQIGHGTGQLVATGLGVATGAMIGSSVGASMNRSAYYGSGGGYAAPVTYGFPAYQPTYVAPPAADIRVVYVPQPVVVSGGFVGAPPTECRPFTQTTRIGGEIRTTQGTACLQPDGTWRPQ